MLLSSSNRKYPPFPLLSYFPVGVCLRCLVHHILLLIAYVYPGKTRNLFSLLLGSLWWLQIVEYALAWRSYSFICTLHHLIIIIVQTYLKTLNLWNACQIYCECVSKIKHILSVIHFTTCRAVCFQFTHSPYDGWENIYIPCLIIKSKVWTITRCLGLGHETILCPVCLSIFFFIYIYTCVCVCVWLCVFDRKQVCLFLRVDLNWGN